MRARILSLLAVPVLALTTACSGDDTTGVDLGVEIAGTYQLKTINGAGLPYSLRDDTVEKIEVTMGAITLNADGTFRDEIGYMHTPVGGVASPLGDILTGQFFYDVDLNAVFFEVDGGGTYDLSLQDDGTMIQMIDDFELVYGK